MRTTGIEIFLVIHLSLGAISVSFLVAYLIGKAIDGADQKKMSKASMLQEQRTSNIWMEKLDTWNCSLVAGIVYGMLYEKWSFTESLYFILSTCQTSGLLTKGSKQFVCTSLSHFS